MARGRDAADVAISTTFGPNILKSFRVWTDEVVPGPQLDRSAGWAAAAIQEQVDDIRRPHASISTGVRGGPNPIARRCGAAMTICRNCCAPTRSQRDVAPRAFRAPAIRR